MYYEFINFKGGFPMERINRFFTVFENNNYYIRIVDPGIFTNFEYNHYTNQGLLHPTLKDAIRSHFSMGSRHEIIFDGINVNPWRECAFVEYSNGYYYQPEYYDKEFLNEILNRYKGV